MVAEAEVSSDTISAIIAGSLAHRTSAVCRETA